MWCDAPRRSGKKPAWLQDNRSAPDRSASDGCGSLRPGACAPGWWMKFYVEGVHMKKPSPVVFLLDVDNTLLDNDRVTEDLQHHLTMSFGTQRQKQYWAIFEELRTELGYADYLGALQRYRAQNQRDPQFLQVSHFLINYPFANRLFPGSLDAVEHIGQWGPTVILSDGDVVFQPRKIERSGLLEAVAGRALIYIHKDQELGRRRKPIPGRSLRFGGRQAADPDRGQKNLGRPAHIRVCTARPLCPRPQGDGRLSRGGRHDRMYCRPRVLRPGDPVRQALTRGAEKSLPHLLVVPRGRISQRFSPIWSIFKRDTKISNYPGR